LECKPNGPNFYVFSIRLLSKGRGIRRWSDFARMDP